MKETLKSRILYLREEKIHGKASHKSGDTKLQLKKLGAKCIKPLHMMFVEVKIPTHFHNASLLTLLSP